MKFTDMIVRLVEMAIAAIGVSLWICGIALAKGFWMTLWSILYVSLFL